MSDVSISVNDMISPQLKKLNKSRCDRLTDYLIGQVGKEFAQYEANGFMSGQVLGVVSGETKDSVKFFKLKKGHMRVRPGAGVDGRLNYLSIYERGGDIVPKDAKALKLMDGPNAVFLKKVTIPRKPFVSMAYSAYEGSNKPEKLIVKRLDKMFDNMGLAER